MIVALVPAAGKSERMGQSKLLLPLGPRRVIEHVLVALGQSQIDQTVVILPPAALELVSIVERYPVELVELREPTPDMRSSILEGLAHAETIWRGKPLDGFLVALADQPTLSPAAVDQLLARFRESQKSVFIPTCGGMRGHPVLFAWKHAVAVQAIPPDRGLNHLVAELAAEVEECSLCEPGVLDDLDTPQDYERLRSRRWPG